MKALSLTFAGMIGVVAPVAAKDGTPSFQTPEPNDTRVDRVVALVFASDLEDRRFLPDRWLKETELDARYERPFCRPLAAIEREPDPAQCTGIALGPKLVAFPRHCSDMVLSLADFRAVRGVVLDGRKLRTPPEAREFKRCFDTKEEDLILCRVDRRWDGIGRLRFGTKVENGAVEMLGHPWGLTVKRIEGRVSRGAVQIAAYYHGSGSPLFVGKRFIGLLTGADGGSDAGLPCETKASCLIANAAAIRPIRYVSARRIYEMRRKLREGKLRELKLEPSPPSKRGASFTSTQRCGK